MRACAILVALLVSSTASADEEKKKEEPAVSEALPDLDLDLDGPPLAPIQTPPPAAPNPSLDLDLDFPPPPVPEPAPLPVITVKRRPPPDPPENTPVAKADPLPTPTLTASPPPPAPAHASHWTLSAGLLGAFGGMAAATPNRIGVSDTGSSLLGLLGVAEYERWEFQGSVRRVFQDRWLAANVRSDGAWEGSLRAGRWFWSPMRNVLVGALAGAGFRSHGAPAGAWWAARGPAPSEWRWELVPSAVWRVADRLDVTVSLPFGYGAGSVDHRDWRSFSGPFAEVECALRFAVPL